MLIPSNDKRVSRVLTSLSRRVNANSQLIVGVNRSIHKLIKKGEC